MFDKLRPYIFRLESERAHALTLAALRLAGNFTPTRWFLSQIYKAPEKPVELFGLRFKNPVGIAAGYDKNATAILGLSAIGFGVIVNPSTLPAPLASFTDESWRVSFQKPNVAVCVPFEAVPTTGCATV